MSHILMLSDFLYIAKDLFELFVVKGIDSVLNRQIEWKPDLEADQGIRDISQSD